MSNISAPPPPPPTEVTPQSPLPPASSTAPPSRVPLDEDDVPLPKGPPPGSPWTARARYAAFRWCGTLVMEPNHAGDYVLSLGKLSATVLLVQAMIRWGFEGQDIPQSMLQTLWILLGYNFGTKGVHTLGTVFGQRDPPMPGTQPPGIKLPF